MDLISEIKKSKKYSAVYQNLLERVCAEESAKYKKYKEKIKAVKNRLHEIYGAFISENSVKSAEALLNENVLRLNISSNERLPFIKDLYKFIFNAIPDKNISSILDIGCGFNPFALPFIFETVPELNIKSYHAVDIDINLAKLINKYFTLLKLPENAGCIDIISETPPQTADVAFFFKVIPTIENCKKGRGFEILNNLNAKYIVVSFPTKTLCGKNKGTADNYAAMLEGNLDYEKFEVVGKNIIGNELVYIIKLSYYSIDKINN